MISNTITGGGSADGFGIYAPNSLIEGNTVIGNNGWASGSFSTARGGGISAPNSTVYSNTVNGNAISAWTPGWIVHVQGAGIYAPNSAVEGNRVDGNIATAGGNNSHGGGIYVTDGSVVNNIVSNNSVSAGGDSALGGGIYASNSTVSDNDVANSSGRGGGGIYASGGKVTGNTVSGCSAQDGGGIYASGGSTSNNTISNNLASNAGGGIYAQGGSVKANTFISNSASVNGGGIYADYSIVSANIISRNLASNAGGGIFAYYSPVLTNTVISNTASEQGAGVYCSGSNDISGNYVVSNTGPAGLIIGGLAINGTPQVHHNNLFNNEPYDVVVLSSSDISGTLNYWGTEESIEILDQIYDWYDDSGRGRFLYLPFLTEFHIPPPFGLTADFHDDSVDLRWDPHPYVIAGWGYNLYYDTDTSGPPYEGTGTAGGNSPIDVGNVITYTLSGTASGKNYFIALTIHDAEGREGGYSLEVHHDFGVSVTPYSRQTPYGSSITYTVMLTTATGFHTPVDLRVVGLLDGAVATFEPSSVKPEGSAILTITIPATATTTTYPLSVVASKSGITHTATAWLTVLEAPAPRIAQLSTSKVSTDFPTDIAIYGQGFLPVPTVTVGITSCSNVTWLSSTHITATVPAGLPEGKYDVIVKNPDGKSHTMYDALTVTSLIWDTYLPLILKNRRF